MALDLRIIALALTAIVGVAWSATGDPAPTPPRGTSAEGSPTTDRALPPAPRRLHCRVFPSPLDVEIDTRDLGSDLGRWVIDLEDRGWEVSQVDFEVGQKPTGFSEGYVQVCMTPILVPR